MASSGARRTRLDEVLFALLDRDPAWSACLNPADQQMVELRREGASLLEIAKAFDLTKAGVRARLYGSGTGLRRGGGVLGRLRGLARRQSQTA